MFKAVGLLVVATIFSAGGALAEQRKVAPRVKVVTPIAKTNIQPSPVVSQLAAQTLQLNRMEKMIADNHKLTAELRQQVAALTAQETAQQQRIADLQTRLQSVQNGIAGLTNVQAQIASNVLHTGQYVIDDWERVSQNCYLLGSIFIRLYQAFPPPGLSVPVPPCDNLKYTEDAKRMRLGPFNQQNFLLKSIPGFLIGAIAPAPK